MASAFEEPLVIGPSQEHEWTVILVHGRNSDPEEFSEELFDGKTPQDKTLAQVMPNAGWVFPGAHERYSTTFQEDMTEWFDIKSLSNPDSDFDLQVNGLAESIEHIHQIIKDEMEHVPADRIILGGMSQGFAVASHTFLSQPHRLAGFIGLNGWIPRASDITSELKLHEIHGQIGISTRATPDTLKTAVYISHSSEDGVVEIEHGKSAAALMERLGLDPIFDVYESQEHWVQEPQGYGGLAAFMQRVTEPGNPNALFGRPR